MSISEFALVFSNENICICSRASDYGLMKIDSRGRVVHFSEKPKGQDLQAMVIEFSTGVLIFFLVYVFV